ITTSSASRASSSNLRLIPPRPDAIQLPMDRFGHQRIDGAGRRVEEARRAAQEEPVPEEDAQEIDRRIEHQLEHRGLASLAEPLLGLEPRVDDFLLHLLVQGQAALMPEQS